MLRGGRSSAANFCGSAAPAFGRRTSIPHTARAAIAMTDLPNAPVAISATMANAVTDTTAGHLVRTPTERSCISDAVTLKASSLVVLQPLVIPPGRHLSRGHGDSHDAGYPRPTEHSTTFEPRPDRSGEICLID